MWVVCMKTVPLIIENTLSTNFITMVTIGDRSISLKSGFKFEFEIDLESGNVKVPEQVLDKLKEKSKWKKN